MTLDVPQKEFKWRVLENSGSSENLIMVLYLWVDHYVILKIQTDTTFGSGPNMFNLFLFYRDQCLFIDTVIVWNYMI